MTNKERSTAQSAADERYETKRATQQKRFGGRCSEEEKQLLIDLCKDKGLNEKELIFEAVRFYKKNSKEANNA